MSLLMNILRRPVTVQTLKFTKTTPPNFMIQNVTRLKFCTTSVKFQDQPSPAETNLIRVLAERFPKATDIAVVDISGGCGSMYEVYVEAPDFKGIRIVKQHQLVTEALKKEIGDMHGIRISTNPSPCQH
eukprot:TRINITY_DN3236_c0_g2_i1.p1 TRINITY_DN3236_c0_g2~~TRINITY_DN3236_c0_g2_i1.p1  ORF type:complete len:129 (+),score=13.47 TRINITY_DN3236_c0_g2_i1:39-425(+)